MGGPLSTEPNADYVHRSEFGEFRSETRDALDRLDKRIGSLPSAEEMRLAIRSAVSEKGQWNPQTFIAGLTVVLGFFTLVGALFMFAYSGLEGRLDRQEVAASTESNQLDGTLQREMRILDDALQREMRQLDLTQDVETRNMLRRLITLETGIFDHQLEAAAANARQDETLRWLEKEAGQDRAFSQKIRDEVIVRDKSSEASNADQGARIERLEGESDGNRDRINRLEGRIEGSRPTAVFP